MSPLPRFARPAFPRPARRGPAALAVLAASAALALGTAHGTGAAAAAADADRSSGAPAGASGFVLPPAFDAPPGLAAASRTGVLYDRVLPVAHLERLDGSPAAPATDLATWRQAWDELRRASLAPPAGPDLAALAADARAAASAGLVPLAVLDRRYERMRREPGPAGAPLAEARAVAAAALVPRTFRGSEVTFALEPRWWLGEPGEPAPRALELDCADGLGPRAVRLGERVRAHYASPGARTLRLAWTRADGSRAVAPFRFEVAALATPTPTDTLHVTASVPWRGAYGTGDAYVDLAPGHAALTNPVIVIEGFDLDNSMYWDELYALLNRENLLETLRADGFDAVVLNFTDATLPVEENGLLVAELVQEVEAAIAPDQSVALVGASMGALCSRYALDWLETQGVTHRVRTWISFDGPHAGADIPLGLQHWIDFFSGQSTSAAAFRASLERPAAREMLLDHFSATAGSSANPAPERDSLAASFAAVGGYPRLTRRVAIANGSGTAASQGFPPGAQVIRYEYSSLLASITGDVWALPNAVSQTIFNGSLRIVFSTTKQTVTVAGTPPWDGAPGGSRASFTQLDTTQAPYGDIVALYPSHCFIPTISALALATGDPFFNVSGAADPLALSPFDALYWPADNQEHVLITPENAAWLKNEIEQGVVGVPGGLPGRGAAGTPTLSCAPNPSVATAHLAWALPEAGPARLTVYGVDGRVVRTLADGTFAVGSHLSPWDGTDARGARVGPGVYFVRLLTTHGQASRRIVRSD